MQIDSVITIFTALLCECRILFHSCSLAKLTIITQSMLQLLWPFQVCRVSARLVAQ